MTDMYENLDIPEGTFLIEVDTMTDSYREFHLLRPTDIRDIKVMRSAIDGGTLCKIYGHTDAAPLDIRVTLEELCAKINSVKGE